MAKFATSDLFVVLFPHTDGYSYDTGSPDEVFTSKEEAQAYADDLSDQMDQLSRSLAKGKRHYVVSLDDRIDEIKDNARSEGMQNQRDL